MSLRDTIALYNAQAKQLDQTLSRNPYSDTYQQPQHSKDDPRYGRPEAGSKTEKRGIKAGNFIAKNIIDVCEVIDVAGDHFEDGTCEVEFGKLFKIYQGINDKVVGMLLRARKYGLVTFEGEMLYQRQDDEKIVTLLLPMDEIRKRMKESGDPKNCISVKK